MAPAHESETIVFNFRKLLSTLPNYAEMEQILLFSVNWGKQVWSVSITHRSIFSHWIKNSKDNFHKHLFVVVDNRHVLETAMLSSH